MTDGCPRCHGKGRVYPPGDQWGFVCPKCDGTGSRWHALLLRAYRMGYFEGVDAMRNAMPFTLDGAGHRKAPDLIERLIQEDEQDG